VTVYKGKINGRQFANFLRDKLIAEGYSQISSNIPTDGMVFYSKGSNGTSDFYIKLVDQVSSYLTIGIYEKYVPAANSGIAGAFTNGYDENCIRWDTRTLTAAAYDRVSLNYILNITKDRVIIFVEGLPLESGAINTLTYIGLPKRYDPNDINGNFAGLVGTAYTDTGWQSNWGALRNRALLARQAYPFDFYLPVRSYGWASKLFFSPIFLGSSVEGARGELDGLSIMEAIDQNNEIRHLDTFAKNGKTYQVIVPTTNSYYHLNPAYTYLMEV
jgi:hypothetical protein